MLCLWIQMSLKYLHIKMIRYDQLCFGAFQYIEPSEQKSEIIKRSLPQLEFYHLLLVFIYCSFAWWYYTCITLYFYYELYEKLQDMLRGALTCNGYTVEGHKVKFLRCILKRDKAEY